MFGDKKGFTLLEIIVATAIFVVIGLLILLATMGVMRMITGVDTQTAKDAQGSRALQTIGGLMRPAILPVYVDKPGGDRSDRSTIFFDIDSKTVGFGNSVGIKWRNRLNAGMDSIAFVVPVDVQGVGDYLDDAMHLQVGQLRPDGRAYLGSTPVGTPNTGSGFLARAPDSNELVNALAAVDPDRFTSPQLEKMVNPENWGALVGDASAAWPEITCFMAIRYLPRLDQSGDPVVLREKGLGPNNLDVDLDGDGNADGRFHVGRLQMLYTGGRMPRVENGNVVWQDLPQTMHNLTSDVVLRKVDEADRTPIFRLVDFDSSNIALGGDTAGTVKEGAGMGNALVVRLLILDTRGMEGDTLPVNPYLKNLEARWYETRIILRNMSR